MAICTTAISCGGFFHLFARVYSKSSPTNLYFSFSSNCSNMARVVSTVASSFVYTTIKVVVPWAGTKWVSVVRFPSSTPARKWVKGNACKELPARGRRRWTDGSRTEEEEEPRKNCRGMTEEEEWLQKKHGNCNFRFENSPWLRGDHGSAAGSTSGASSYENMKLAVHFSMREIERSHLYFVFHN